LYENTENTQEGQVLQIWRWLICGTHSSALICTYISENKKSVTDIITNEELLAATENILQDLVIYLIFFLPLSGYINRFVRLQNFLNFEGSNIE